MSSPSSTASLAHANSGGSWERQSDSSDFIGIPIHEIVARFDCFSLAPEIGDDDISTDEIMFQDLGLDVEEDNSEDYVQLLDSSAKMKEQSHHVERLPKIDCWVSKDKDREVVQASPSDDLFKLKQRLSMSIHVNIEDALAVRNSTSLSRPSTARKGRTTTEAGSATTTATADQHGDVINNKKPQQSRSMKSSRTMSASSMKEAGGEGGGGEGKFLLSPIAIDQALSSSNTISTVSTTPLSTCRTTRASFCDGIDMQGGAAGIREIEANGGIGRGLTPLRALSCGAGGIRGGARVLEMSLSGSCGNDSDGGCDGDGKDLSMFTSSVAGRIPRHCSLRTSKHANNSGVHQILHQQLQQQHQQQQLSGDGRSIRRALSSRSRSSTKMKTGSLASLTPLPQQQQQQQQPLPSIPSRTGPSTATFTSSLDVAGAVCAAAEKEGGRISKLLATPKSPKALDTLDTPRSSIRPTAVTVWTATEKDVQPQQDINRPAELAASPAIATRGSGTESIPRVNSAQALEDAVLELTNTMEKNARLVPLFRLDQHVQHQQHHHQHLPQQNIDIIDTQDGSCGSLLGVMCYGEGRRNNNNYYNNQNITISRSNSSQRRRERINNSDRQYHKK